MAKLNSEIRREGLDSLKGRWGAAVLICFIYSAISAVAGSLPVICFASILITLPLLFGLATWFLSFCRVPSATPDVNTLFLGFNDYIRVTTTLALTSVYTLLWSLLFIVPGFIKGLSYSLTSYILVENPEIQNNEAIELSMAMMKGNKMRLFLMSLNFMMWVVLSCVLTVGIGLLWVIPYIQTTMVAFYEDVKRDYNA